MKKFLIGFLAAAILFVVAAVIVAVFFMGSIIQTGVQALGPELAKVDVQLAYADFSPITGRGEFRGIVVGNPKGFKTPTSITIDTVSVDMEPSSILSDKMVIHSLKVKAPQITLEATGPRANNIAKILENVQSLTGGGSGLRPGGKPSGAGPSIPSPVSQAAGRKMQVDEFVMSDAKINLSASGLEGAETSFPMPEIKLKDLGANAGGISMPELAEQILQMISSQSAMISSDALTKAAKKAGGSAAGIGNAAKGVIESLTAPK